MTDKHVPVKLFEQLFNSVLPDDLTHLSDVPLGHVQYCASEIVEDGLRAVRDIANLLYWTDQSAANVSEFSDGVSSALELLADAMMAARLLENKADYVLSGVLSRKPPAPNVVSLKDETAAAYWRYFVAEERDSPLTNFFANEFDARHMLDEVRPNYPNAEIFKVRIVEISPVDRKPPPSSRPPWPGGGRPAPKWKGTGDC